MNSVMTATLLTSIANNGLYCHIVYIGSSVYIEFVEYIVSGSCCNANNIIFSLKYISLAESFRTEICAEGGCPGVCQFRQ